MKFELDIPDHHAEFVLECLSRSCDDWRVVEERVATVVKPQDAHLHLEAAATWLGLLSQLEAVMAGLDKAVF